MSTVFKLVPCSSLEGIAEQIALAEAARAFPVKQKSRSPDSLFQF